MKFSRIFFTMSVVFVLAVGLFLPIVASADSDFKCDCMCDNDEHIGSTLDYTTCVETCSAKTPAGQSKMSGYCLGETEAASQTRVQDPLGIGSGGPTELYARIIRAFLGFIGVAALVTFVFAGFGFIFSGGNPEKVKKTKDMMVYAILGVFIAMGSYALLDFLFRTLETSTGN